MWTKENRHVRKGKRIRLTIGPPVREFFKGESGMCFANKVNKVWQWFKQGFEEIEDVPKKPEDTFPYTMRLQPRMNQAKFAGDRVCNSANARLL